MAREKNYDFAGWATKNDIQVSDGTIIRHNAFAEQDGQKVPLVWEHDRSSPSNIIGSVILHNRPNGVYAHGTFNDTPTALDAREALEHGDINAMSIAANNLKRQGPNIMHGKIFEVSLVIAGANPGALIESVINHGDGEDESAIIYPGTILHAASDEVEIEEPEMDDNKEPEVKEQEQDDELDIEKQFASMTPEQLAAVNAVVEAITDEEGDDEQDTKEEETEMKENVFNHSDNVKDEVLTHSQLNELLAQAKEAGSLQHAIEQSDLIQHADVVGSNGIVNIEKLFPEAKNLDTTPRLVKDEWSAADKIVAGTTKSPFSRIKSQQIDITSEDARARGYLKGGLKVEQFYKQLQRITTPTTVYTKTKFDRDDILDIQDFDVVLYANNAMKIKMNEEIARAILSGDGRPALVNDKPNPDKISEDNIRPIVKEDDLYAIKITTADLSTIVEDVVLAKGQLQASGTPSLYMNPETVSRMMLTKKGDGSFLYGGDVPSQASIAATLGVREIVPTSLVAPNTAVIVNLSDYVLGSVKGGQLTTFNDFDIDYNQYKYLLEGRMSGALRDPKTAMVITITDPTTIQQHNVSVKVVNSESEPVNTKEAPTA